jgi:hypothetical protein
MVTVEQIQRGFTRFVDNCVSNAFCGWQKAVVAGAAALLAANFPNLVKAYGSNPILSAFGVYEPDGGYVDIDALYNAFIPNLGGEKVPIVLPKIGTIRLGKEEFDTLLRYIKES